MAKLGKTETALLKKAAADRRGRYSIQRGYVSMRRNSDYGNRDRNALVKLRNRGFVEIVGQDSGINYFHNGSANHYTITSFVITQAGRDYLNG